MARLDWVETRLLNWARWRAASRGGGALGFSAVSLGESNAGRSGYVTAVIPISDVEASDTEDTIQRLSPRGLALTLIEVYCMPGSYAEHALALSCAESTVHARVSQAHQQLAGYWLGRDAARRAERKRVEALQRRGR